MTPLKLLWIVLEAVRMGWACRQCARGFPWTVLPIPPRDWVKWRLDTFYGEHNPRPPWRRMLYDTCAMLLWRRRMRMLRKAPRMS